MARTGRYPNPCKYLHVDRARLICYSSVLVHFREAEREWRASPSASWKDSSGQSQVVDAPLLGSMRCEPVWLAQNARLTSHCTGDFSAQLSLATCFLSGGSTLIAQRLRSRSAKQASMYVRTYVRMYVCMYVCMYACMCVYLSIYIYI